MSHWEEEHNEIALIVEDIVALGTADDAMQMMTVLRAQAHRLDVLLGNPAHQWNRVDG